MGGGLQASGHLKFWETDVGRGYLNVWLAGVITDSMVKTRWGAIDLGQVQRSMCQDDETTVPEGEGAVARATERMDYAEEPGKVMRDDHEKLQTLEGDDAPTGRSAALTWNKLKMKLSRTRRRWKVLLGRTWQ